MHARVAQILNEALSLEAADRSLLLAALADSLGNEDEATVAGAWAAEIRARRARLQSGHTHVLAWADARVRLDAL